MADEFPGGVDPLVGPEAPDYAVHDVEQEADGGLAVVGALAHDAGDSRVVCQGRSGEGLSQVIEGLVALGVRGWILCIVYGAGSDCSGTTVGAVGALGAPLGVALDAGQPGDGVGDDLGRDSVDLHRGLQPVACLEAFVVELSLDDVAVEFDDDAAVTGLLANDVRAGWRPVLVCLVASAFLWTHAFYYEGWMGVCQGAVSTAEVAESAEEELRGQLLESEDQSQDTGPEERLR